MRTKRLLHGALVIYLAAAVVVAGCGSDDDPGAPPNAAAKPDLSNVTLRFADIGANWQTILKFAGEDKTPYKLQWADFAAAPPISAALSAGDVDVTAMSFTALSVALAGGVDVKAVALSPASPATFRIISKESSGIRSPADLKGKKVGVLRGNAGEGLLIAALKSVKLTSRDVTLVNVEPNTGVPAFKSGRIDAWSIWDPWAAQAALGDDPVNVVADAKGIWSNDGYVVATPVTLEDPGRNAALADLLTRFIRAGAKIRADREAWAKFSSAASGLPLDIARPTLEKNTYQVLPIGQADPANFKLVSGTLAQAGIIKPLPAEQVSGLIDTTLDAQIKAADARAGA